MTAARRGVTRAYVVGLMLASAFLAMSLIVAAWGLLSYGTGTPPVRTRGVPMWASPVLIALVLAALCWSLWAQALVLLRGRRAPAWQHIVSVSIGAYLLWCLGGILAGLSIEETWTSLYAILLVPICAAASLFFWAVLARRVYTDRPAPQWPWERKETEA